MLLQRILMASRPKLITRALKGNDRSHGGDQCRKGELPGPILLPGPRGAK